MSTHITCIIHTSIKKSFIVLDTLISPPSTAGAGYCTLGLLILPNRELVDICHFRRMDATIPQTLFWMAASNRLRRIIPLGGNDLTGGFALTDGSAHSLLVPPPVHILQL